MILTQRDAYALIHAGCIALADVEANGIRIDTEYLQTVIDRTNRRIIRLQQRIKQDEIYILWKKIYGQKMNLGSNDQFASILFKHMDYECTHRTKVEKKPSITEASLEALNIPFAKRILKIGKLKKVATTYLKGFQKETVNGFIHPFYNLHTTRTFRSSSSEPNFQNIPIRNPEMKKIVRRCFIPRDGHVLIESDYGRLEVCVAACYNKDPVLINYIKDKSKDMHRDMAAECFMIPTKEVTGAVRGCTKAAFVFAQFYGDFYGHCAQGMWTDMIREKFKTASGVPMKDHLQSHGITKLGDCTPGGRPVPGTFSYHIQKVERRFWKERFRQYDQWKMKWWNQYQDLGYFDTLTGFHIKGDFNRKEVINYPIQGSGFHCLLWTLIVLNKELCKRNMEARIVGQIHDSILADVPVDEVDDYVEMTRRIATQDIKKAWDWITVPLEMDFEACPEGGSWYDKKLMEV